MPYTYTLHRSITEIPADDWNQLRYGDADPLMDRRFVLAVEQSMSDRGKFWHVLFRDDQGKPAATACLCAFKIDGTLLAEGGAKKVAEFVGRVFPWLVTFKLLLCGLPVSAGQSSLRFAPDADTAAILKQLDAILMKIGRKEWARAIILKEFNTEECARLEPLAELGYLRADSLPMNHADPNYRSFEDYLEKLPSRKRYPIRKAQKKFAESGLRVVQKTGGEGVEQLFTDDVQKLYENVLQKASVKFERLPAEFFRAMAREMPDATSFTFVYQEDRIVAFAVSAFTKSVFHQMFVGVDHSLNPETDLYFNLFFNAVDFGLKLGVQEMPVGQTADKFKEQKLGCVPHPLYFYVKGVDWPAAIVIRKAFHVLFPPRYGVEGKVEKSSD